MKSPPAAPTRTAGGRWLIVAALLVCALVGWVWWRSPERARDARNVAESRVDAHAAPVQSATPTLAELANDASHAAAPMPAPERAPVRSQRVWRLRGTLELIDPSGQSLPPEEAELEIVGWTPRRAEHFTAAVDARGGWTLELELPSGVRDFSIGDIRLRRGSPVQLLAPLGRVYAPADGEFIVRCQVLPHSGVRVVDAATGVDLHDIYLQADFDTRASESLDARDGPSVDLRQRRSELRIASGLSSPIDLSVHAARIEALGVSRVRVVAPGYTWSSFHYDSQRPSFATRALEPAGELMLALDGSDVVAGAAHAAARLRQSGVSVATGVFDERQCIEWSGLLPGRYELELLRLRSTVPPGAVHFDWEQQQRELAVLVDVRAGQRQSLRVALGVGEGEVLAVGRLYAPDTEDFAGLRGLRLVSRTANGDPQARRLELVRLQVSDRPGFACFEWRAAAPRSGPFELRLQSPYANVYFSDLTDQRVVDGVDLGPCAELVVRLTDGTGAPTRVTDVDRPALELLQTGVHFAEELHLAWSAEQQAFVARAQPGRYVLRARLGYSILALQDLELDAPRTEERLPWWSSEK